MAVTSTPTPTPNPHPDPHQVLFSGFFVSRRATHKSHFHTDFNDTANLAFTLMTPLYDMSALPDCQLLCKAPDGAVQQYRYALGRAVVFGDSFVHATETGVAPRALEVSEIEENIDFFDFELSEVEQVRISALRDKNLRIVDPAVRRPVWDEG